MQDIKSNWGRSGIRVSDPTPTRAIRYHLARTHVATPMSEVVAEVEAEIARMIATGPDPDAWTPQVIRDTVRFTRWQHLENRAEYEIVMGGAGV